MGRWWLAASERRIDRRSLLDTKAFQNFFHFITINGLAIKQFLDQSFDHWGDRWFRKEFLRFHDMAPPGVLWAVLVQQVLNIAPVVLSALIICVVAF